MTSIRPMTADDIPASQRLLAQLGYPLSGAEIARRYAAVAEARDHAVLVAEDRGRIIGLCDLYARPALDKPPEVVVQALVVDRTSRGKGVGNVMMTSAETWATDHDFTSVALASSVTRPDAHAFYERIGYQRTATSHLFRKGLPTHE